MIEINNVLCPVDLSDHSRRALDYAIAIARRYDATVTVLNVLPGSSTDLVVGDHQERLAAVQRFIATESTPAVAIEVTLREGRPVPEIGHEIAALRPDLMVLGTHGRSGFERLFLGSVTERLLHKAACPILTVPPRQPDAVPAGAALFNTILCAVDFSPASMHALAYATQFAQEAEATLLVAHVLSNEFEPLAIHPPPTPSVDTASIAGYLQWRRQEAERLLDRAVPDSATDYCTVERHLLHGQPARALLALAESRHCDVMVMGVRGRGAVDRTVFGSVTERGVRGAMCPVLTVLEPE